MVYQSIIIRVQVASRVGHRNPAMIHQQDTPISPVYCTLLHCCSIQPLLQAPNSSSIITYSAPARCPGAVTCGPEQAGDTLLPMLRAGLDTLASCAVLWPNVLITLRQILACAVLWPYILVTFSHIIDSRNVDCWPDNRHWQQGLTL